MNLPYLLALDIGTASIGFVVFSLDENYQPVAVRDLGVRIFSDGRDPKTKEPLAVSRRTARGIRRTRDRGQNRVRRLVKELVDFRLLPAGEAERKRIFDQVCPYSARAQAVHQQVDPHTLGRAIFHIGRRRGFKSNRLAGESEESEYKNKINDLRKKLNGRTLGEYLCARIQENRELAKAGHPRDQKVVRFRNGETDFYADRQMYWDEFTRIRKAQDNGLLTDEQWDALQETVFWQYPLKPVPKGKCQFYQDEPRAHIDLPLSHEYRIYTEVNALRYVSQGVEYDLDERQRMALYTILNHQKNLTFKGLLKKKDENKAPYFPSDATFNLDTASRSGKLLGNGVMCELRKAENLGQLADSLEPRKLNDIVAFLIEPLKNDGGRQVVMENTEVKEWLAEQLPELSQEQVESVCRLRFKRGTTSVSRKFMAQIVPVLRDTGMVYSEAVATLKDDHGQPLHHSYFETGEVLQRLPYYGEVMPESVWGAQPETDQNKAPDERDDDAYQHGKIANPTVHVALNQLRVVVNRIIDQQGRPPAKIHVELTRDLKNSKEARRRFEKQNRENKANNDRIREILKDEFDIDRPSREDIQKVKLWEELGKKGARCSVFSGRPIGANQLFNGEVEIEHIIPFSRCYDDGMSNKTLAFRNENQRKRNKTPAEAFGESPDFTDIKKRALASFGQGSKYERFKDGAFEKFYGGEEGNMIQRQLSDTKYISRKARQYLSCLCTSHNVVPVNGRMTAVLRDVWKLNQFKDRSTGHYRDDHRHHIVDAFVVGLTSRRLIQQLSTRRELVEQTEDSLYRFLKNRVQDIPALKQQLVEKLESVVVSYKPDHAKSGSMFNDTAYGLRQEGKQQYGLTRKAVHDLSFDEVFQVCGESHQVQLIKFLTDGTGAEDKTDLKVYLGTEKKLHEKCQQFSEKYGIKKLRIQVPNNSIKPIASAPYKGYAKNSYAYCDVWQIPYKRDPKTGKWLYKYRGSFVAYADVKKYANEPMRPIERNGRAHPAAKRLMRLYKDDNVRLTGLASGSERIMRIAGYNTERNKLDIRQNRESGKAKQNFISINTIFSENLVSKLRS